MAFQPVINFNGFDRQGAVLYLTDTSPYGVSGNPPANTVTQLDVVLSLLNEEEVLTQTFTNPTQIASITAGNQFEVNSYTLGKTVQELFLPFEDGVMNIDYYVFTTGTFQANGAQGNKALALQNGNTTDYKLFDFVKIGTEYYTVDKTLTSLTTLYVLEPIVADATTARAGFRDNLKILNTKRVDYKLAQQASKFALCCDVNCTDLELLAFKEFAQISFDNEDYSTATKLLSYAECSH